VPLPQMRVVAALITSNDGTRLLVQQRPAGKQRALLWELPGGKVEVGESDELALMREAREELGVDLEVGRERFHTEHAYPDAAVDLHVYEARVVDGIPRNRGAQVLKEATVEELRKLQFCQADQPLVVSLVKAASEGSGRIL
jgi:8-oxo-dGTP diphosphatase